MAEEMEVSENQVSGVNTYRKYLNHQQTAYLPSLLRANNFGTAIRADYDKNGFLSETASHLLCDIIVTDLINSCNSKICHEDFSDLASEINKLFPNEQINTYFVPPVRRTDSPRGVSEHARGRLYNKFRNKLQQFRRLSGFKRCAEPTPDPLSSFSADVKQSLSWLEHNTIYSEELIGHWAKTSIARSCIIKKQNGKVSEYLRKYPVLRDPINGQNLISIDFKALHSTDADNIYLNWSTVIRKLMDVTAAKKCSGFAQALREIIKTETTSERSKELAEILLLSHFIPPKAVVRATGKVWKPTIVESQNGLAVHVKVAGDINEMHRSKIDKMFALGLTVQPYIIAVGETLTNVQKFYVMLDDLQYQCESPLKALDTCFKIFFTLNAEYPRESAQAWLFLQYSIYKFRTAADITKPHVTKVLQQIGMNNF